jgi:hypothetical protein
MRDAFLYVALGFVLMFGGMTLAVTAESGFDVLSVFAIGIVLMLLLAVLGAIRTPPDD